MAELAAITLALVAKSTDTSDAMAALAAVMLARRPAIATDCVAAFAVRVLAVVVVAYPLRED